MKKIITPSNVISALVGGSIALVFASPIFPVVCLVYDFQAIFAALLALGAAAWTIRVTIFHREEEKFLSDRAGVAQLRTLLSEPKFDTNVVAEKIKAMPMQPLVDYGKLAILAHLIETKVGFTEEDIEGYALCVCYFQQWLTNCMNENLYVEYTAPADLQGPLVKLLNMPTKQDLGAALQADN